MHAQSFAPCEKADLEKGRQVFAARRTGKFDCLGLLFHDVFLMRFRIWRFILSFQKNQLMPTIPFTQFSPRFGELIPAQDMWR